MRRMLDPKTLGGGGSGGTTRHAYRITISYYCWFLSLTEKDYGYKIGSDTDIPSDFYTNDRYKDLLSNGKHPAGGYYKAGNEDRVVSFVEIYPGGYNIGGYLVNDKRTETFDLKLQNRVVKIIQLS